MFSELTEYLDADYVAHGEPLDESRVFASVAVVEELGRVQATCSRYARERAEFWSVGVRPKRVWTWLVSQRLHPSGVICEIMNADGSMARLRDLRHFCIKHGLKMITVAELALYRLESESAKFWEQLAW